MSYQQHQTGSFQVSLFRNRNDNQPRLVSWSWETFCGKLAKPLIRQAKDGALFSPARFHPAKRLKKNVVEVTMLVLDYDHNADLERDLATWQEQGLACALYTSHSHGRVCEANPQAADRFRIVVPLEASIPANLFPALWQWAANLSGRKIDEAAKDSSRMFYLPAKYSAHARYEYRIAAGKPLDWRELGLQEEFEEKQKPPAKKVSASTPIERNSPALTLADEQVIELARERNGARFDRLYSGDSSDYLTGGKPDASRGDFAFVLMLAPLADDEQLRRIWVAGGRCRDKLTSHRTYVDDTIRKARIRLAENETDNPAQERNEDISALQEVPDDDPAISNDPKREAYLRRMLRNDARVLDTRAIILRLLDVKKPPTRLLNALTTIGSARLGVFRAYQASIRERYESSGEACSLRTVKNDIKNLCKQQTALGVVLVKYKPGTKDFSTDKGFPCSFQNLFLRYVLQAINLWLDALERAKKENLTLSAKERRELLEAACREIVATIPRTEPVKPKEKPPRFVSVEEMEARFEEVETLLIATFVAEGWSKEEIEREFERLESRRQSRLQSAIKTQNSEAPIRVQSLHPYRETEIEPDLEVFVIQ